jgi:hypothetical protein
MEDALFTPKSARKRARLRESGSSDQGHVRRAAGRLNFRFALKWFAFRNRNTRATTKHDLGC